MVSRVRALPLVLLALAAAGCGSAAQDHAAPTLSRIDKRAPDPAAAAAVREYVRALDRRDRSAFCDVLAPWVQARVGALLKEFGHVPAAADSTPEADLCVGGASFIGYYGENADTRWTGTDIEELGAPRAEGTLTVVDLHVRNHFGRTNYAVDRKPRPDRIQSDRVYLVSIGGKWRIAKLSALADTAGVGFADNTPPAAPPDLAGEQARLRAEMERTQAAARRNRAVADHPYTACSSVGATRVVEDPPGDVFPDEHPPAFADLRAVAVASSDSDLCFDFTSNGPMRAPATLFVRVRDQLPSALDRREYDFYVALKDGGQALVVLRGDRDEALDAAVGISRNRMSVVIPRDAFPAAARHLFDRFAWSVESIYDPPRPTRSHVGQLQDHVPEESEPGALYP